VVVGAVLLDGAGRVLGAERAHPEPLAGRWEFPGGKVQPGESEPAALRRECREELGVDIVVNDRLGDEARIDAAGQTVLRLWTARIVAGRPEPLEHAQLRWLTAAELDGVRWLPADGPLLPAVRALLAPA
jgi:8-oxo-dGTP diphosphatase